MMGRTILGVFARIMKVRVVGLDLILSLALVGPMASCDRHPFERFDDILVTQEKADWAKSKISFLSYESGNKLFFFETSASASNTPIKIKCEFGRK